MTTTLSILLFLIGGLTCLTIGAETLLKGATRLAVAWGITPLVVGMTVVAYGTSAPEVAVTVQAVYSDPPQPDLAIGNVVGSNISNILLVLGIASLVAPLLVSRSLVRFSVPIMIAAAGLVWGMSLDGQIGKLEGIGLLSGAVLFSVISVLRSRAQTAARARAYPGDLPPPVTRTGRTTILNLVAIGAGLALLVLGSRWLVEGATQIARLLNVSELIVGLTIVAVGTSLPEIATSLVASIRNQRDIAVGNVVGSNIFNLLLVLGFCATLSPEPVRVQSSALRFDIPIMFAVSLAAWPIFYTEWTIKRWEGFAFLVFYGAYTMFLYLQATQHGALNQYTTAMVYFILPISALVLVVFAFRHWQTHAPHPDHPDPSNENRKGAE